MKHAISFKQYRGMDVFFFTSLLCICEGLIIFAATRWFPAQPYTLSLVPAVTAIVMMRWGLFAAIPSAAGAVIYCLLSGAGWQHYAIYMIGNLAALTLLPFIRRVTWKRIHDNVLLCMAYGLMTALIMQAMRAVISLILGCSAIAALGFITTDILSTLFSVLLCWMMRRLDGMLEDQEHYLIRVQKEQEQGKGV